MSGLIFLAVVGLWFASCFWLVRWLLSVLPIKRFKSIFAVVLFVAVFSLPVIDELAARPQFNSLCEKSATLRIDGERVKGRTLQVKLEILNEQVEKTLLPVTHSKLVFRDTDTGEILGSYDTYTIQGGFLARWSRWPESGHPWTYEKPGCGPDIDWINLPTHYGFTLVK